MRQHPGLGIHQTAERLLNALLEGLGFFLSALQLEREFFQGEFEFGLASMRTAITSGPSQAGRTVADSWRAKLLPRLEAQLLLREGVAAEPPVPLGSAKCPRLYTRLYTVPEMISLS